MYTDTLCAQYESWVHLEKPFQLPRLGDVTLHLSGHAFRLEGRASVLDVAAEPPVRRSCWHCRAGHSAHLLLCSGIRDLNSLATSPVPVSCWESLIVNILFLGLREYIHSPTYLLDTGTEPYFPANALPNFPESTCKDHLSLTATCQGPLGG